MRVVKSYLAGKQDTFRQHPFFSRLARNDCPGTIAPYASALTFWVMTFQDILRLNESLVTDACLREVAVRHRVEDAGHDRWFLEDLIVLNGAWPDVRTLYSEAHHLVRDAAYALMSELFRAQNDYCRVALLLTLESAGHAFFEQIAAYHERVAPEKPLKYFSRVHVCAEQSHAMFERELQDFLATIVLDEKVAAQAMVMIDRVYEAFDKMFRCIEEAIIEHQRLHYVGYTAGPCATCETCTGLPGVAATAALAPITLPAALPPAAR